MASLIFWFEACKLIASVNWHLPKTWKDFSVNLLIIFGIATVLTVTFLWLISKSSLIDLIEKSNSERKLNEVVVGYVVPNSPAEKSGIMKNDIIIKVGNKDIATSSDVISEISKNGINKKINILLKRRNKLIRLKVIPTDITKLQNN